MPSAGTEAPAERSRYGATYVDRPWRRKSSATLEAIFLPSFLLVFATLPFREGLRRVDGVRRAVAGTNAALVGILVAALYTPIWTSAVQAPVDVFIAGLALAMLIARRVPPIAVVGLCAIGARVVGSA